jgi:hypothetical protein
MNQSVAALGAEIQHDAKKVALRKTVPKTKFTIIYESGLRNPTYGRKRCDKGSRCLRISKFMDVHHQDLQIAKTGRFPRSALDLG